MSETTPSTNKWASRKLWTAIGGVILVILTQFLGLDPEIAEQLVTAIITLAIAFIAGESVIDAARALFTQEKTPEEKTDGQT